MPTALDLAGRAAREHQGKVVMGVRIAVANAAAVKNHGMIEKSAIAVGRRIQLLQKVGKALHVKFVDLHGLGDLLGIVLMMRDGVMSVRHPDRAVTPVAAFAGHHEADYPRHVRLEGDHHQVAHQLRVFFELIRDAVGALEQRHLDGGALLFRLLNPPLDIADAVEVFVQLALVARTQSGLEARHIAAYEIEDTAVFFHPLQTSGRVGGFAVSEHPFKNGPRVDLHGIRHGGIAPRNRIRIRAAITAVASAGEIRFFKTNFERSELSFFAEFVRGDLVGRNVGMDIGALGFLRVNAGQPCGPRPRVVARAVAKRATAVLHQIAQNQHLLAKRFQRLHGRSKFVSGSLLRGEPAFLDDPVRNIYEPKAHGRLGRGKAGGCHSRYHGIEQRQSQRGS